MELIKYELIKTIEKFETKTNNLFPFLYCAQYDRIYYKICK